MCLGEFQSRQAGCSDGEALLWSLIKNCELYIHHALVSGSLKGPRLFYSPSFLLLLLVFVHLLPRFLTITKVALTSYHQNHRRVMGFGGPGWTLFARDIVGSSSCHYCCCLFVALSNKPEILFRMHWGAAMWTAKTSSIYCPVIFYLKIESGIS